MSEPDQSNEAPYNNTREEEQNVWVSIGAGIAGGEFYLKASLILVEVDNTKIYSFLLEVGFLVEITYLVRPFKILIIRDCCPVQTLW